MSLLWDECQPAGVLPPGSWPTCSGCFLNSVRILILILQPCTITWHRQKPGHLATVHEADTCMGGRTKESLLFMTAVFSDCCSWIHPPNTRVGSPACNHYASVSLSRSTRNGCTGTWITKTNIQERKPKSIRRWGIKKMCSGFYGKLTRPWF